MDSSQISTKIISIDPSHFENRQLHEAVEILQNEGIVAFPTETVYGLGASALSEKAINKIYIAKGRPLDNPLIVHIESMEMLETIVKEIPEEIRKLCNVFWPGPLTILFLRNKKIPDCVTAGLPTVAVRMPQNPIALRLISLSKIPIAAPSANISGRPSPTTAAHVKNDFEGKIPLIIDGGSCPVGVESTVLDVHRNPPLILRPGGVNYEDLKKYLPNLKIYEKHYKNQELKKKPPSTPGLKYRHYSPKARVILIENSQVIPKTHIHDLIKEYSIQGKIGYIHTSDEIHLNSQQLDLLGDSFIDLTHYSDDELINNQEEKKAKYAYIAQKIFWALRKLDNLQVQFIIIEGITEDFSGLAVMNRLRKAAWKII